MTQTGSRARALLGLVGVAVLLALLVITLRQFDLPLVVSAVRRADLGWLALAAACFVAILPLWALEWWILSPPTPRRTLPRMLAVVAMTSSVLNTAPMLAGEAAGVLLLVLRTGLTRAAALSVLAMDQLFVGLAKVGVITVAAYRMPLPAWLAGAWPVIAGSVLALLLVLLTLAWRYSASGAADRHPTRLMIFVASIAQHLRPLRSARRSGAVLVLACSKKTAELVAIICVQRAFGISLPADVAILILAALAIATLLPLLPSNIGVYEAAVVLVYVQAGIPREQALAMALTQHMLFFVCAALPGYPLLVAEGVPRRAAVS